MAAILIEAPASEPISLAEGKNYLRVDHAADDALIQAMISAARIQVESRTRRALMTQSWRVVLDRWPSASNIDSPVSPLRGRVFCFSPGSRFRADGHPCRGNL